MIGYIWTPLIAIVAGFVLLWFALLIALAVTRPADLRVTEILRLLPIPSCCCDGWPPTQICRAAFAFACCCCSFTSFCPSI